MHTCMCTHTHTLMCKHTSACRHSYNVSLSQLQLHDYGAHPESTYILIEDALPAAWEMLGQVVEGKLKQATGGNVGAHDQ